MYQHGYSCQIVRTIMLNIRLFIWIHGIKYSELEFSLFINKTISQDNLQAKWLSLQIETKFT